MAEMATITLSQMSAYFNSRSSAAPRRCACRRCASTPARRSSMRKSKTSASSKARPYLSVWPSPALKSKSSDSCTRQEVSTLPLYCQMWAPTVPLPSKKSQKCDQRETRLQSQSSSQSIHHRPWHVSEQLLANLNHVLRALLAIRTRHHSQQTQLGFMI